GPEICGAQRCENTPGSYRCTPACDPGYQPTPGGGCQDVDECRNRSFCGAHAVCQNLPGSFQCLCDQGYEGARDGRHCVDVNECETLQGVCGAALCENVEGSFLCVCPNSPEEFDPMTGRCVPPRTSADVDECQLFRDQVCKNGVCVNTAPGYSCYCSNGYYYHTQRLECIDNDECADEEPA
ncbi:LTBP4 isoform 35, partial [Pongo abelii]